MMDPGGTAVSDRRFPIAAIVVPIVLALAIVLYFGLRGSKPSEAQTVRARPAAAEAAPAPAPPAVATATPEIAPVAKPDPAFAGRDLERSLRALRLWSTIEIAGPRIDVRSSSCSDPAMAPTINGNVPALHNVGLTKLRCLSPSGAVVFERDL